MVKISKKRPYLVETLNHLNSKMADEFICQCEVENDSLTESEMCEWANNHFQSKFRLFVLRFDPPSYLFYLTSDEDLMMFKLRWL